MSNYSIRELTDNDWRNYKAIRLKSLQDSPDSFGSTYEREVLFETDQWKSRLNGSSTAQDSVTFAAVDKESFVGLLSCVIQGPGTHKANFYQMWVAPEHRGHGVGLDLVKRAQQWAFSKNVNSLSLSVTMTNSAAINLYSRLGFKPVGETEMLRPGSNLQCQIMEAVIDVNSISSVANEGSSDPT